MGLLSFLGIGTPSVEDVRYANSDEGEAERQRQLELDDAEAMIDKIIRHTNRCLRAHLRDDDFIGETIVEFSEDDRLLRASVDKTDDGVKISHNLSQVLTEKIRLHYGEEGYRLEVAIDNEDDEPETTIWVYA